MPRAITLVIGNKNYSSWSLRPWLLLRQFDIAFEEIKLPLDTPEFYQRLKAYSPAGRVPVLVDEAVHVWDSLAICETVSESLLEGRGWPADRAARAQARAISAEMHSGFSALRTALPMNCRKRQPSTQLSADVAKDIARIVSIWRDARQQHAAQGDFLFGKFSIADAMYAPVVLRFVSYGIALESTAASYAETILALPALQDWLSDAETEALLPLHEQDVP
jgi:glutathione S-transferase